MKRNKLLLASTAAAVLAVFNPAFAGGDSEYNKDSSASAGANNDITAGANVGSSSSMGSGTTLGDSTAGAEPGRDALLEKEQLSQAPAEVNPRTGLDEAHPAN